MGWGGVGAGAVGLAENKATQPSLAGAWAELGNIRGIAHACTNRKDDIFMQRRLVQNFTYIMDWGQGTCTYEAHIFTD